MKAIAVVAAACCMSPMVFGADMPQRKPGLWQIEIESSQAKGASVPQMRQCIDEKTDRQMQDQGVHSAPGGKVDCSKQVINRTASGWESDSVCKIGDSTASTHATMQGDFNTRYTIDSRTKFDPPLNGTRDSSAQMKMTWLGACPANMKPGDVDVNGHIFNAIEMQKQRANMPTDRKMTPEQMERMMNSAEKQETGG